MLTSHHPLWTRESVLAMTMLPCLPPRLNSRGFDLPSITISLIVGTAVDASLTVDHRERRSRGCAAMAEDMPTAAARIRSLPPPASTLQHLPDPALGLTRCERSLERY